MGWGHGVGARAGVKVADRCGNVVRVGEGTTVGERKVVGVAINAGGEGAIVGGTTGAGEEVGEGETQLLIETTTSALIAQRTRLIVRLKEFVCARNR